MRTLQCGHHDGAMRPQLLAVLSLLPLTPDSESGAKATDETVTAAEEHLHAAQHVTSVGEWGAALRGLIRCEVVNTIDQLPVLLALPCLLPLRLGADNQAAVGSRPGRASCTCHQHGVCKGRRRGRCTC